MPRTTDAPETWVLWHTEAGQPVIYAGERVVAYTETDEQAEALLAMAAGRAALLLELAEARPVVALIERAATETYMGATGEVLLMAKGRALDRLLAAWDQLDHARALAAREGQGGVIVLKRNVYTNFGAFVAALKCAERLGLHYRVERREIAGTRNVYNVVPAAGGLSALEQGTEPASWVEYTLDLLPDEEAEAGARDTA